MVWHVQLDSSVEFPRYTIHDLDLLTTRLASSFQPSPVFSGRLVWIERLRHRDVTKCRNIQFKRRTSQKTHDWKAKTANKCMFVTLSLLGSFLRFQKIDFSPLIFLTNFVSIPALGALFCTNSSLSPVPKSGYLAKACRVSAEVEKEFLGHGSSFKRKTVAHTSDWMTPTVMF